MTRPPSLRIHRRKAVGEISFPESGLTSPSIFDPERESLAWRGGHSRTVDIRGGRWTNGQTEVAIGYYLHPSIEDHPYGMSNPVIYIGGQGYSYEYFEPIIGSIERHFDDIVGQLKAINKDGKKVEIELKIDKFNPEVVDAFAKRKTAVASEYLVYFSAGFSYHLWLTSRAILAEHEHFSWVKSCKLSKKIRTKGRNEALADYAFYLISYHTVLHELAHVYLGHCDFIQAKFKLTELNEFGTRRKLTPEETRVIRGLEAEADRQASEWLVAFFERSLGLSKRGTDFVFPSRMAAYEFFVYAMNLAYMLNQQLTLGMDQTHPLPNQRQYTAVAAIGASLKKMMSNDAECISLRAPVFMLKSAKKTGLVGAQSVSGLSDTATSMLFVDDVIKETGIREYQHSF